MTNAEQLLWFHLRRKQILSVQFYRQKPIGNYIVDFYAPCVQLVIEIDGGQHFDEEYMQRDKKRDSYLAEKKLKVLRFDNLQVLQATEDVMQVIYTEIYRYKNPPDA